MMRHLVHFLLFTLTALTLVIAPPPPISKMREIWKLYGEPILPTQMAFGVFGSIARHRTDVSPLASRFPHVPVEQRELIGDVPQNLYPLIRGADRSGGLTLARPEPGYALLLTQPFPDWHRVRGVGMATNEAGHTYFFRTEPFVPKDYHPLGNEPIPVLQDHVPPRSSDATLFGSRKLNIDWGDGHVYSIPGQYPLSHISMVKASDVANPELPTIYSESSLDGIKNGPYLNTRNIEWSKTNNWSRTGPLWAVPRLQRWKNGLRRIKDGIEWRAQYYAWDYKRRLKALWRKVFAKPSPKPTDSPGGSSHAPSEEEEEAFHMPGSSFRGRFNDAEVRSIQPEITMPQGVVNLDHLLTEPSGTGQYWFNSPQAGQALLLTEVLDATTARGIGQVHTLSGEIYFFRTQPFQLKSAVPNYSTVYPARQVFIRRGDLQSGTVAKLSLSHASLVPLNAAREGLKMYTPKLLEQVLSRKESDMVAWNAVKPNWSDR